MAKGALGQVDGHDHGQHLGGQPDGHGHGKQESFQPVVLAQPVDEEHRRNHHGDEADHQPGELVDALSKLVSWRCADNLTASDQSRSGLRYG